ncbi:hypothetical protein HOB10_02815 [Candidatus Parcubacteria bacterium]|jgi:hypothetical protein|nr:hypothetical protein [Candidatus Parcubacteria bacterium]
MENNKKLILIIVVVVLVLAVVGFILMRSMSKSDDNVNNQNTNSILSTNDNIQPGDNGNGGGLSTSYKYRDAEFIHLLDGLEEEDLLALRDTKGYLMSNKMYQICLRSADADEQEECLERLRVYQINQIGKPEMCDQLDTSRDSCLMNIAVGDNDTNICKDISDQDLQKECINLIIHSYALQQDDASICYEAFDEENKLNCMKAVAHEHQDLDYCDTDIMVNNDLGDTCRSIVLINHVSANNDNSICEQIPLQDYKDMCFTEFAL